MQLELGFDVIWAEEMEPFVCPIGDLLVEKTPRRNEFAARMHAS